MNFLQNLTPRNKFQYRYLACIHIQLSIPSSAVEISLVCLSLARKGVRFLITFSFIFISINNINPFFAPTRPTYQTLRKLSKATSAILDKSNSATRHHFGECSEAFHKYCWNVFPTWEGTSYWQQHCIC